MARDIKWACFLGAVAIAGAWGSHGTPVTASPKHRPVVVAELFTSEGCSSCPPADAVLSQLRLEPPAGIEVLTLGEHVDYWDRLGWRDRFSSVEYSSRQATYDAKVFQSNEVYTPQLIVDGRLARVGSDIDGIRRAIREAAAAPKAAVDLSVGLGVNRLLSVDVRVEVPTELTLEDPTDVVLALTENSLASEIRGGENRGRTLRHDAVVRQMRSIGSLSADDRSWQTSAALTLASEWNPANVRVICFLQERETRRIVGAGAETLLGQRRDR